MMIAGEFMPQFLVWGKNKDNTLNKQRLCFLCHEQFIEKHRVEGTSYLDMTLGFKNNTEQNTTLSYYGELEQSYYKVTSSDALILFCDTDSDKFKENIDSLLSQVYKYSLSRPVNNKLPLLIVGFNHSDQAWAWGLQEKKIASVVEEFKNNSSSLSINIVKPVIVTQNEKEFIGMEKVKQAINEISLDLEITPVMDKLFAELVKVNKNHPKKIDGISTMMQIIGDEELTTREKYDKIISTAYRKKSDYAITRFFHQNVRGRLPEIEQCYRALGELASTPATIDNIEKAISLLKNINVQTLDVQLQ